ncbi:MAG TPA: hypothetical protein VGK25_07250 [Ignavibacteria bacterium]
MIKNNSSEITNSNSTQKHYLIFAVLIAISLGLASQILSYHYNYNFAYRDSIFRLEAARRFFDSNTPGMINQMGTVWLPVPNLILMPFSYIDFLWETGLAASIVNFPSFVICAIFIFLSIKKLTKNAEATWFGFLMFVFNYNILYFQTTSMTEQFYLTFLICSFYFLLTWAIENKIMHLIYSSIFICFSVGTRYDAWPVALAAIVIVFVICIYDKDKPVEHTLIFGLPPIFLIISWFLYNWIWYGDPLEFSRGRFSTLHQLEYYEDQGRLLTKNNFWLSAKVYLSSVLLYSGKLYTIMGFIGLIIYILKNKLSAKSLPVYLLWVALPTTLILLLKGQLIIELPDSEPAGYFNSRYGLYLFPAIAVFSGITASYLLKWKRLKIFLYLLLAYIFIIQQLKFFDDFPAYIPSIAEAEYSYSKPSEDLSFFLKYNYKGGKILYDNLIFALYPWTGIDLDDRITFHTYKIAERVMNTPSQYVNWVLVYKDAPNDKIYEAVKNNPDFLNNFELKFSESGVEAYVKK